MPAGPHTPNAAVADIDDGITTDKQDGYVQQQTVGLNNCLKNKKSSSCSDNLDGTLRHDAVGYHNSRDIPNYWAYAQNFVLQDRLFAGVRSWSVPVHLDLLSEWVATCSDSSNAWTCKTAPTVPKPGKATQYPWVNLFQLLDLNGVSWKYYLANGLEPDCEDDEMTCEPQVQTTNVPGMWNEVPYFQYVKQQGAQYLHQHDVPMEQFLADVQNGQLPQVAWIVPNATFSEHPPSGITAGMEYVTSLVNAVMQSPYWQSTAIFIAWDDWGGFYDHVTPPNVDTNKYKATPIQGFGIRVPGLMLSAWARRGYIDHALYSFNSYATFFENLFMGGARLDPTALGNPDHRPDIRDALTSVTFLDGHSEPIGDLMSEFDFTQTPLPPVVLSTHIPTGITATCSESAQGQCQSTTVTIGWDAVSGAEVAGPFVYHILRDGADLAQCTGSATSCTDLPGSGTHVYTAYSVDPAGAASPTSAGASVIEP